MAIDKQVLKDAINAGFFVKHQQIKVSGFQYYAISNADISKNLAKFAELTKASTKKVKEGYVLVPIEPTDEMIKELTHEWHTVGATSMYDNYTAMIKAVSND
jgi:hypothetical protein